MGVRVKAQENPKHPQRGARKGAPRPLTPPEPRPSIGIMSHLFRIYWIIYYLAYLIALALLFWLYWGNLMNSDGNTRIFLLAAIFGTAVGVALALAILAEIGGRIVLLIPARIRELKRQGRREQNARYEEALKRFGVEKDGVITLSFTPEVRAFLDSETEESGNPGD